MKLRDFMMGTLLVFSLLPLIIYGAFTIYETNEKIDSMLKLNIEAIDEETIKEDAERILKFLEAGIDVSETGKHISVTCSIGIVTAKGRELDYMHLIRMADQAMYEAKDNGKNSVVVRNCAETQE